MVGKTTVSLRSWGAAINQIYNFLKFIFLLVSFPASSLIPMDPMFLLPLQKWREGIAFSY